MDAAYLSMGVVFVALSVFVVQRAFARVKL